MAKLYEVETTLEWVNLETLAGATLSGDYELYNSGREHDVVNIFYTESASEPTNESFYKAIKRQDKVVLSISTQPIWVKSEVSPAKLMISTPSDEISGVEDVLEKFLSPFLLKREIVESGSYTYIGFAQAGTLTSVASWMVVRIDSTGTQLHADGNTNFDNIFNNYAILSYS